MQRGIDVSLRIVYRAMCEGNLIHSGHHAHEITKATTEIQEQENLIQRDFSAEISYTKLPTDITEVPCSAGKRYVSPIMDCRSGEILAPEMRNNIRASLNTRFFPAAGGKKPIEPPLRN